jgi:hypothetical protein
MLLPSVGQCRASVWLGRARCTAGNCEEDGNVGNYSRLHQIWIRWSTPYVLYQFGESIPDWWSYGIQKRLATKKWICRLLRIWSWWSSIKQAHFVASFLQISLDAKLQIQFKCPFSWALAQKQPEFLNVTTRCVCEEQFDSMCTTSLLACHYCFWLSAWDTMWGCGPQISSEGH